MPEKIYPDAQSAREAVKKFKKEYDALEERFGVFFEENDSSAGSWFCAKYYDLNGNIQTYCD